jgi:predicted lipoprotein with Yx(FWY)xxD motif
MPNLAEVTTGTVNGLGTVLVNGEGLTLYMFEPDRQSGRSTCYEPCQSVWEPDVLNYGETTPVAGAGVSASLLGTIVRTNGLAQITYNRWPLYFWDGDRKPGQATGQALNNYGGLWYVLSPEGIPITALR